MVYEVNQNKTRSTLNSVGALQNNPIFFLMDYIQSVVCGNNPKAVKRVEDNMSWVAPIIPLGEGTIRGRGAGLYQQNTTGAQ